MSPEIINSESFLQTLSPEQRVNARLIANANTDRGFGGGRLKEDPRLQALTLFMMFMDRRHYMVMVKAGAGNEETAKRLLQLCECLPLGSDRAIFPIDVPGHPRFLALSVKKDVKLDLIAALKVSFNTPISVDDPERDIFGLSSDGKSAEAFNALMRPLNGWLKKRVDETLDLPNHLPVDNDLLLAVMRARQYREGFTMTVPLDARHLEVSTALFLNASCRHAASPSSRMAMLRYDVPGYPPTMLVSLSAPTLRAEKLELIRRPLALISDDDLATSKAGAILEAGGATLVKPAAVDQYVSFPRDETNYLNSIRGN